MSNGPNSQDGKPGRTKAFITVTDAAGRVLFRRPATAQEVQEALEMARHAEEGAQVALSELAARRAALASLALDAPPSPPEFDEAFLEAEERASEFEAVGFDEGTLDGPFDTGDASLSDGLPDFVQRPKPAPATPPAATAPPAAPETPFVEPPAFDPASLAELGLLDHPRG